MARIEMRSYKIGEIGTHVGLVFIDATGKEMHLNGFASNRSGTILNIGLGDDDLLVVTNDPFDVSKECSRQVLWSGDHNSMLQYLNKASVAGGEINLRSGGYSLLQSNSNSAAFSILDSIGLGEQARNYSPPGYAPGWRTSVFNENERSKLEQIYALIDERGVSLTRTKEAFGRLAKDYVAENVKRRNGGHTSLTAESAEFAKADLGDMSPPLALTASAQRGTGTGFGVIA